MLHGSHRQGNIIFQDIPVFFQDKITIFQNKVYKV